MYKLFDNVSIVLDDSTLEPIELVVGDQKISWQQVERATVELIKKLRRSLPDAFDEPQPKQAPAGALEIALDISSQVNYLVQVLRQQ